MGRGEKAKRLANPDSKMAEQVTRSTLVPIIPLSRFSRAREFPYPHLALGKPAEEADADTCGRA